MDNISKKSTMQFKMPLSNVELKASFGPEESSVEYFHITPEGAVSGSDYLKSLPEGSIDLVIPEMIDGITSTSIPESGFSNCVALKTLYVPSSINAIGDWAFVYCDTLKSININKPAGSIGGEPWGVYHVYTVNYIS